jgi:hypothetical protein
VSDDELAAALAEMYPIADPLTVGMLEDYEKNHRRMLPRGIADVGVLVDVERYYVYMRAARAAGFFGGEKPRDQEPKDAALGDMAYRELMALAQNVQQAYRDATSWEKKASRTPR